MQGVIIASYVSFKEFSLIQQTYLVFYYLLKSLKDRYAIILRLIQVKNICILTFHA